jgi:hypothetical protein
LVVGIGLSERLALGEREEGGVELEIGEGAGVALGIGERLEKGDGLSVTVVVGVGVGLIMIAVGVGVGEGAGRLLIAYLAADIISPFVLSIVIPTTLPSSATPSWKPLEGAESFPLM